MRLPSKTSHRETVVRPSALLPVGLVLLLHCPLVAAQNTLGELLDAGARRLSAAEFKEELVQRVIVGPTEQGGSVEVMYAPGGKIQGVASPKWRVNQFSPINGTWTIGDQDAICTTMTMGPSVGNTGGMNFPTRCQFWFKHGERYFLTDSDWDRSSKVLSRTLKR